VGRRPSRSEGLGRQRTAGLPNSPDPSNDTSQSFRTGIGPLRVASRKLSSGIPATDTDASSPCCAATDRRSTLSEFTGSGARMGFLIAQKRGNGAGLAAARTATFDCSHRSRTTLGGRTFFLTPPPMADGSIGCQSSTSTPGNVSPLKSVCQLSRPIDGEARCACLYPKLLPIPS
jgi:hypothetical protein